jgi:hypothetical protein
MPAPEQRCIYVGFGDLILAYPDAPPAVEEGQPQAPSYKPQASIVHGVLLLPPSLLSTPSSLLSVDGRTVLELKPGANDVRALAPGVYFVREEPQAVRKVVIAR